MKLKLVGTFIFAFVIFCFVTRALDIYSEKKLAEVDSEFWYLTFKDQGILNLTSPALLERSIQDPKATIYFGSSELSSRKGSCYPTDRYAGTDRRVILAGAAGSQSLIHAISWIGLTGPIKAKSLFMISPQWFNRDRGIGSDDLSRWLSSPSLAKVVLNEKFSISENYFLFSRLFFIGNLNQKIEILPFFVFRLLPLSIRRLMVSPYQFYDKWRLLRLLKRSTANSFAPKPVEDLSNISLEKRILKNRQEGEKASTNNEFGIYDDYFNTYIKRDLKSFSGKYATDTFLGHPEEHDFKFALQSFKKWPNATAVIIPVNGKWYDYAAHPKTDRQKYYQHLSQILAADAIKTLNLSPYEYEPFFFVDIMHLGWVGWCFIDE